MEYEKIAKQIEDFLKEKTESLNGGVIGISGGIDSAVVAFLSVRALGKSKVYGLLMPYGKQNTQDAEEVAKILGISYDIVNIKPLVKKFEKALPFFGEKLTKGNLMARVRMCLLYGAANQQKKLVLGTTNKSEFLIAYYTKYGDGGVDIEPIGDLYKTEVWELAKHLGVPQRIIEKTPSADLWPDQTDEGEIGMDYHTLDKILQGETEGIDSRLIEKVEHLKRSSEHKRKTPPIAEVKK